METDPVLSDPRYLALVAENAALRAEVASLREALKALETLVSELQARLAKDSHNSHKPPGSDGPAATPRSSAKPTGRKRGGQPGHTGKARETLPEGSETRTVAVPLACCPHCAGAIPREAITGSKVHRVLDLVQQMTEVIGYQLEEGLCPHCRRDIQAPLPPEAPIGGVGPRLQAASAYLRTEGHMSLGIVQRYFLEVFGVTLSRGWFHENGIAVGEALKSAWEELGQEIRAAEVVNMDETGFGRKDRDWIWVALTARTVFFHFSTTRGFEALKAILPEDFKGVLCTDRYATYRKLKDAVRQYCWAHLRREFIALSEVKDDAVACIGTQLLADQERCFELWHAFRKEEMDRTALRQKTAVILARMKHNLRLASGLEHHKAARNLGKGLLTHWDKLWTFLRVEGVEPTNNSAERALRPLVILKRIFQRLPSDAGKQFYERLLSLGASARLRGVAFFNWLLKSIHAHAAGTPRPALEAGP